MSLWPVSDAVTREMMVDHAGFRHVLGRGEGLRQVELLETQGPTASVRLGEFIESGEWANLDGKR